VLIRQGATWYAGCALYLRDLRLALARGARLVPRYLLMVFKRWLENMIWCVGPILLLLAGTWAVCRSQYTLVLVRAGGVALHALSVVQVLRAYLVLAPDLRVASALPRPSLGQCVAGLIAYPVMLLGTCLGPLLHYTHRLGGVLTGRAVPRSKTARVAEAATVARDPQRQVWRRSAPPVSGEAGAVKTGAVARDTPHCPGSAPVLVRRREER
jgi:hypothetical protein